MQGLSDAIETQVLMPSDILRVSDASTLGHKVAVAAPGIRASQSAFVGRWREGPRQDNSEKGQMTSNQIIVAIQYLSLSLSLPSPTLPSPHFFTFWLYLTSIPQTHMGITIQPNGRIPFGWYPKQ